MGRLTTIKPRVQTAAPRLQGLRSGDDRIRGTTLQAIRRRILTRDAGLCQCARCRREGAIRFAELVDHTVPLWAGGREADSNRQSISSECHDLKSAHEAACRARGSFEAWQG